MLNICHCFLSPLHQKMAKILWMAQFFARILYIHGAFPLLCSPLLVPFYLLGTLQLCQDRPPQSQVPCKLTPTAPPFTQPTPPLQIPRIPTAQRLTKTTSGIFRLLLSGTLTYCSLTDIVSAKIVKPEYKHTFTF
jgi:hypothetical protein